MVGFLSNDTISIETILFWMVESLMKMEHLVE